MSLGEGEGAGNEVTKITLLLSPPLAHGEILTGLTCRHSFFLLWIRVFSVEVGLRREGILSRGA